MRQSFLNLSVLVKAHLSPPREWGWLFLELVLVPTIQVLQLPENKIKTEAKLIYDRQSIGQSILVSGSYLGSMARFLLPL
jgi:hypothetical protein